MKENICAVLVTFNRKMLLLRCLQTLMNQTVPVSAIFIVDNASNDGTLEMLRQNEFVSDDVVKTNETLQTEKEGIKIYYSLLDKNTGGAGGFHHGLRGAFQLNRYDYFWMMDDDGYPDNECLEKQCKYIDEFHYVMPVSIDIDNFESLSWPVRLKNGSKTTHYDKLASSWGEIMPHIFPFNGSLLTKELVARVGFPKKELFIWGDEYEHYWRCIKEKFKPITILDARFYHPANKMSYESIIFGLYKVPYTDVDWRFICLIRNSTYLYWNYSGKYKIIAKLLVYTYLFLIKKKLNISKYSLYLKSVKDGIRGDFDRHFRYMAK
jgi:rhamnopyranosyl-N-acetylglucosaminyl-diphospho-decaprenol beta-1,3/1,4-galactofuranosyltransferase